MLVDISLQFVNLIHVGGFFVIQATGFLKLAVFWFSVAVLGSSLPELLKLVLFILFLIAFVQPAKLQNLLHSLFLSPQKHF